MLSKAGVDPGTAQAKLDLMFMLYNEVVILSWHQTLKSEVENRR